MVAIGPKRFKPTVIVKLKEPIKPYIVISQILDGDIKFTLIKCSFPADCRVKKTTPGPCGIPSKSLMQRGGFTILSYYTMIISYHYFQRPVNDCLEMIDGCIIRSILTNALSSISHFQKPVESYKALVARTTIY
ncbi:hypothetical protein BDA96_04G173600 [Sorghum bicolor]|jgi:hypothetical protein|uniref:Uncharacterized protein n=1 Tax=Sorghum bicolor TaxID=4558 RepID=A0A921UJB1_SORBI|nr:hypothetical protein BDA96_04G173600 [Sorghum bicolor]